MKVFLAIGLISLLAGCASLPGQEASKRTVCIDGQAYVMAKWFGLFTSLDRLPDADKLCAKAA